MQDIKQVSNTNLITASIPVWCNELGSRLHLPLIQRNFVWKPEQIAFLWDSILRGFPLGTLLVVSVKGGVDVKQSSKIQTVHDGWLLLDGQQRSRAIKGGYQFTANNGFRVWLGMNTASANPKLRFDVRVTTLQHPFGFDAHFKPLSMHQRMSAYTQYENEQAKSGSPHPLGLASSRPYTSGDTRYFPIDAFFNDSLADFSVEKEALSSELRKALDSVRRYQIIATSVDPDILYGMDDLHSPVSNEDTSLPVELLFERVGSGGTRLSNEDYAYSLIKQRMPGAHIVVERALEKPEINELFSPLAIVSIVLRLSCSFGAEGKREIDDVHYAKTNIFRIIENKCNAAFIQSEIVEANRLFEVLRYIVSSLYYHASDNQDGLPVQLLRALPISFWQLLVIWKWNTVISQENRSIESRQLIAFTLLWLLHSPNTKTARKITRYCVKQIGEQENFSANWLCEQFCLHIHEDQFEGRPVRAGLVSPEVLEKSTALAHKKNTPLLKNKTCRIDCLTHLYASNEEAQAAEACLSAFWYNKKLLLWFQRYYLDQINAQKKVKISSHITPFDYDHIIPQNFWSKASTSKGKQLLQLPFYDYKTQHNAHLHLGNSIGNYQLLSFADNRIKQDKDYQDFIKGFSGDLKSCLLIDERADFAFRHTPSKENEYRWNEKSVKAFQEGVELRLHGLYREFYEFMMLAGVGVLAIKT